jgi:hypothetical protein
MLHCSGENDMSSDLTKDDLSDIRDAVPNLDLVSIRALRRAGFAIVRSAPELVASRTLWNSIPRPMQTSSLASVAIPK